MKPGVLATAVLVAGEMLSGCGHEGDDVPAPRLVPSALVDNLYVAPPRDGLSNMSLDSASFRLRGRCLEIVWNGGALTPAFVSPMENVSVVSDGIRLPYITVPFGRDHSLLGPLVPTRIRAGVAKACPPDVVFVAGLARPEDMPKPVTPPAAPAR